MSRLAATFLTAVVACALAAPGASARPRHHCPKGKKLVGHTCRAVKAKKKPRPAEPYPGTPITVTTLEGSTATIDAAGATRTAALTGEFKGIIPGGYMLNRDNTIKLTRGRMSVGATDLLTDDCAAPPLAALDPLTTATLDPAKASAGTVRRDGGVTVSVSVILRTVIDQRTAGCGSAPGPSGYADTPLTARLHGRIERETGLARLTLDADPLPATIQVCTAPQAPTERCSGTLLGIPAAIGIHVVVNVRIG